VYALLPVGAGLVLFSALPLNRQPFDTLLASPPMVWIGKLSYSIYLVHLIVIHNAKPPDPDRFALNVFLAIFVLAVAFLLHKCIELPVLQLKDRIRPGTAKVPWPAVLTLGAMAFGFSQYV